MVPQKPFEVPQRSVKIKTCLVSLDPWSRRAGLTNFHFTWKWGTLAIEMTGFYTKYKIGLNWVKFWLALHTTDPLSLDQKKKRTEKPDFTSSYKTKYVNRNLPLEFAFLILRSEDHTNILSVCKISLTTFTIFSWRIIVSAHLANKCIQKR